jgi:hypothetical protein
MHFTLRPDLKSALSLSRMMVEASILRRLRVTTQQPFFMDADRTSSARLSRSLVFGDDKLMRRNSPSAPELFSVNPTQCDFEHERTQFIATIDGFFTRAQLAAPSIHILSLPAQTAAVGHSHVQTRRPSPTTVRRLRVLLDRNLGC